MQFEHTITTTASAEAIWALWTDVAGWPRWDTPVEWARLDGWIVRTWRSRQVEVAGRP